MTAPAAPVQSRARIAAPLRLLIFIVAVPVAAVALALLVFRPLTTLALARGVTVTNETASSWLLLAALLAAHVICLRLIDRRPWSYVMMGRGSGRPAALGGGALVGALAIAVPTLLLFGARWFRIEPQPDGSSLASAVALLLFLAPAALWEELAFRGYLFAVLREWLGPVVAIAATSVVFGVIHWSNPGADVRSTLLVILAGLFLGAVMLATGSLWAAWTAHLAWNWVMAAALHVPVSGLPFATPDYRLVETGPDWLTGGQWGPEGGAGAAAGMLAALYLLVRRAPGWWRRQPDDDRATAAPHGAEQRRPDDERLAALAAPERE